MFNLNRHFDRLGHHIDRLFQEMEWTLNRRPFMDADMDYSMPGSAGYTVTKTKTKVTITLDVPGCDPEDVTVFLDKGMLVTVASPQNRPRREHAFRVSESVKSGDITAKVRKGVLILEVTRPTQDAPTSPVGIPVQQG